VATAPVSVWDSEAEKAADADPVVADSAAQRVFCNARTTKAAIAGRVPIEQNSWKPPTPARQDGGDR
jgi:hypothetical protein